jgi:outer membrane protein OmpA-like peptidoglycan-associated protein
MSRWQAMMTLRAGRRAFYLGFVALCGIGGALPAAAQSYLADNGSNVTVDYSVLGQGAGPGSVNRAPLPGGFMPAAGCSCANAPLGVIASAPRPTFTNPFGAQITQAPAVPPGFMAYSAAVGASSSGGGAVVLKEPGAPTQMAASEPAPVEQAPAAPLPSSTPTQNGSTADAAPESAPTLPPSTPTQNAPSAPAGEATAPSGETTPPAQPDEMPTSVPSPVEQPPAAVAPAPTEQPPTAEVPAEPAPAPSETQTAEAPPPETPPAGSAATSTQEPEQPADQQAAVTPDAPPAEGTTPPAESGGALPAGGTRILYTGESDDVPAASTAELDTIAQDLLANQDKRIQVMAFAAGTEETESKARRKSLARGLAIRSYLIKAGVPSTRIDVRALGNKVEGGPADRVDIIPAS